MSLVQPESVPVLRKYESSSINSESTSVNADSKDPPTSET